MGCDLDLEERLRRLGAMAEEFRVILILKYKGNYVKQEVEKATEAGKGVFIITVRLHNVFPVASGPGSGSFI